MCIKEKLLKRKEFFKKTHKNKKDLESKTRIEKSESSAEQTATSESLDSENIIGLNDKVDQFIRWYTENMIKGHYDNIGEHHLSSNMRNLIEKMAVWYELRYPDYDVDGIMLGSIQKETKISKVMFQQNPYINSLFDANADIRCLDWDEFYNAQSFIQSLPFDERFYFSSPVYPDIIYWDPFYIRSSYLHLSPDGYVIDSDSMGYVAPCVSDELIKGKHLTEVVKILKDNGVVFPKKNQFEIAIKNYENSLYRKERMLDCVMYRIIERGGIRIGPRRGFLFAKEFNRNIDIPMIYGVDHSDSGLRKFVNEYIKAGGHKDLLCYEDYFSCDGKYEELKTISIAKLIMTECNNAASFYTPEEDELHQRLVNVLSVMDL